jgi:hypothetical protein
VPDGGSREKRLACILRAIETCGGIFVRPDVKALAD